MNAKQAEYFVAARIILDKFLLTLLLGAWPAVCWPGALGTAFTYQGRLNDGAAAATGMYDLRFRLYNAQISGSAVSGAITNAATPVTNGLIMARLDFGSDAFAGEARWLEVAVRTNGSADAFEVLVPRNELTPVPHAIFASNAATAAAFSGSVTLAQLPAGLVTNGQSDVALGGVFTGNGSGLTNLNDLARFASTSYVANLMFSNANNFSNSHNFYGNVNCWGLTYLANATTIGHSRVYLMDNIGDCYRLFRYGNSNGTAQPALQAEIPPGIYPVSGLFAYASTASPTNVTLSATDQFTNVLAGAAWERIYVNWFTRNANGTIFTNVLEASLNGGSGYGYAGYYEFEAQVDIAGYTAGETIKGAFFFNGQVQEHLAETRSSTASGTEFVLRVHGLSYIPANTAISFMLNNSSANSRTLTILRSHLLIKSI